MTTLFTPAQRQQIYDDILILLKADTRITGVISIGARDATFSDDNDSINLLVIIEKPSIIDILFTLWVKRLEDHFVDAVLFNFILNEQDHKLDILLDNYLQVTLQFRAINRFHLVGDDWCVVFDHINHIQQYIDNRKLTREQHIRKTYNNHMKTIWQPIVSCVRELRRDNLWKANAELETLRRHLIEIAGLRHLQFTQDYDNMSLLPEMFLVQLRHTLPTNTTDTAIRRALKMTVSMLLTETNQLDIQFDTAYTQQLEQNLNSLVDLYT